MYAIRSYYASLQFGDILNLVGRLEAIEAVTSVVGNTQQKLQQVQMLPVFIRITSYNVCYTKLLRPASIRITSP